MAVEKVFANVSFFCVTDNAEIVNKGAVLKVKKTNGKDDLLFEISLQNKLVFTKFICPSNSHYYNLGNCSLAILLNINTKSCEESKEIPSTNEFLQIEFASEESRNQCHKLLVKNEYHSTMKTTDNNIFPSLSKTISDVNLKDEELLLSVFDRRTECSSAKQYFQFYALLSQQQNMLQDFVRTSTYQKAIKSNEIDFKNMIVLDVGAGSGILSYFAIQAGAKKVYAVEASNMAEFCQKMVNANNLAGKIIVVSGKIEEITIPEPVDIIISEPMGYMLFNERMLETYIHARKFLRQNKIIDSHSQQPIPPPPSSSVVGAAAGTATTTTTTTTASIQDVKMNSNSTEDLVNSLTSTTTTATGTTNLSVMKETNISISMQSLSEKNNLPKMFPSVANLFVAPFTDEALYLETQAKANFWCQEYFHGVNLSSLRKTAIEEYFSQPIVDTFDMDICMASTITHSIDFRTANEEDLYTIEIPLHFQLRYSGLLHGLAFWFDVGFLGSQSLVWLTTAPNMPLTHWYQVRCLLPQPILVQQGEEVEGVCKMIANIRQSYDVHIELGLVGSKNKVCNVLDLKNPCFRYTGVPVASPTSSPQDEHKTPTELYYERLLQQPVEVAANVEYVDQNTTYTNNIILTSGYETQSGMSTVGGGGGHDNKQKNPFSYP